MTHLSALTIETSLRATANQAVKEGYFHSNPFSLVDRVKVPEKIKEYLTLEEIQKFANTPCKHNEVKLGFLFCCFTGLRVSDLEKLTWRNI